MTSRRPRICYAGTYERAYPRNRLMIDALRLAGVTVEEAHVPVFERQRDKSRLPMLAIAGLAARLGIAYTRLIPEVALRLLRCDALAIGYIGQLDMLVLGALARLLGKPVIFNPLVTLTDTIVEDRNLFQPGSVPARLIELLDSVTLSLATLIIADTEQNRAFMERRFRVPHGKIIVVPVGADELIFFPGDHGLANEWLDVLFYGKFIPLHGVETIIQAAARLEDHGALVRFELVGTGQDWAMATKLAEELGVNHIVWTDWIPFSKLGDRIRAADVVLGIFSSGPKAERVVPNKVYQAMACGKPVVTRSSPATHDFLGGAVGAVLVPPADPEALADAIRQLGDADLRRRIGKEGYETWRRRASMTALARELNPIVRLLG